ncbi:undecaprenyl-diphosphate phosphatase [Parvularcula marina]|uniref:undecaprenyl-diphosphate phosphatase n=1 Tax=Parvularcula marina TaxID=2292771 RepID=UPI0035153FB7
MLIIHLIILAIVQGLTEFIPVSSSAHLILAPVILGWEDQGTAIDIAAHIGSLGAVLIYFRQETAMLFRGGIDTLTIKASDDRKLFLFLAVGTIPLVLTGVVLALTGASDVLRDPKIIAAASIIFGIVLYIADRRPTENDKLPSTWKSVMTIGLAQAIATIPGTSRSGITITAARWLGFTREAAARFSMLMAIPAIIASGAYIGVDFIKEGGTAELMPMFVVALFSFVAAYLAIVLFLRFAQKISFTPFVIYRIALGLLIFTMLS